MATDLKSFGGYLKEQLMPLPFFLPVLQLIFGRLARQKADFGP
jgi:hypothetical protein